MSNYAMNKILRAALRSIAVGAAALLSACADTPIADADYGRSVQQMVQAQTLDPAAAANPPELAPESGDGQRLQNVLDVYRKDVAKGTTEVQRPIIFDVSDSQ